MVSEASDVQTFLAKHPPFNHLPQSQLELASANVFVAFGKSGSELTLDNTSDKTYKVGMLVVRSGSLEIRTGQGKLVDRLSSGAYLVVSMLTNEEGGASRVIVLEDCLYYELTEPVFKTLAENNKEIVALTSTDKVGASYSSSRAVDDDSTLNDDSRGSDDYLSQQVKNVMSDKVVSAHPETTIRKAAQIMMQSRISSLLIQDDENIVGILTDRDLRSRVLAEGVSDTEAIKKVMTPSPMSIDVNSRLYDAHLKMMSTGVHHLPVVEKHRPVGMLTLSDMLRVNSSEPLSLIRAINRSNTADELGDVAKNLPGLVVKLIERDARAIEIGKIITSFSDAITRRLLKLTEEKFGAPPCEYAWLAFGSQARQEQVLGSDQDNGLLLSDDVKKEDMDYFKSVAVFVNDGLDKCGMPYCPGDIMAKNDKWRQSLQSWKNCFTRWIEEPSPKAVMHSSIFFDMRFIAGNENLARVLQKDVRQRAKTNTIFLALMSDNALLHSPPLGFFKTFVLESDGDHSHTLNLKKRGTIPIVDIARNYALLGNVQSLNTIERLQALEESKGMSKAMAYNLIDAHEFIAGIRLEAQGKQYRAKVIVNNYLDPRQLSPLVCHQLKDAFHVVREAQSAMRTRFGGVI